MGLAQTQHTTGARGPGASIEWRVRLIILDVMLPVISGFEVLSMLHKSSAVPVIMLTARTAHEDRITGLNAAADDYLPKPIGAGELLARIRAVLRRIEQSATTEPRTIPWGSWNSIRRRERCQCTANAWTRP